MRMLRAAIAALPIILIVALVFRLTFLVDYVHQNSKHALGTLPFLFESGNIAASIATGHGFSSPFRVDSGPTAWLAPLYPLLLAGIFRTFGLYSFSSFVAAALMNILFSTLTCIPIYMVGRRIGGIKLAAAAAWLWAIFPNAILLPFESIWDASLTALLSATIVWLTLKLPDSSHLKNWVGYGALWGLVAMTNPALLSVLPFFLAWLAWQTRRTSRNWRPRIGAVVGVIALCSMPWTIRNYMVMGAFVPLRSSLGVQLWCGNNDRTPDLWHGQGHPISDSTERAQYLRVGEIAYDHEKLRESLDYIVNHPALDSHRMGLRFLMFWSGGSIAPIRDFSRNPSRWFRYVLGFNVLAGVASIGGILALSDQPVCFPLGTLIVVYPLIYYASLIEPRYRLPIDPALVLLSATFLTHWRLVVNIARHRMNVD